MDSRRLTDNHLWDSERLKDVESLTKSSTGLLQNTSKDIGRVHLQNWLTVVCPAHDWRLDVWGARLSQNSGFERPLQKRAMFSKYRSSIQYVREDILSIKAIFTKHR